VLEPIFGSLWLIDEEALSVQTRICHEAKAYLIFFPLEWPGFNG
jgi:hypothetical protein